jgi:RNA recognition motif-containing protein
MVMRDPTTKRARGFGFITFVDPTAVEKVLTIETHELDGKRIDPKVAFPKKQQPKMIIKTKKVFIGGLSSNSSVILYFFLKFKNKFNSWKTSRNIFPNTGRLRTQCSCLTRVHNGTEVHT